MKRLGKGVAWVPLNAPLSDLEPPCFQKSGTDMLPTSAVLRVLCSLLVATFFTSGPARAEADIRVIGEFSISTGLRIDGVEFGGLSGLDYDPDTQRFLALSDDRADRGPARFYELAIELDAYGIAAFEVINTIELRDFGEKPYPKGSVDPEELRLLPNGNLVWTDEGAPIPAVTEANRDGIAVGRFELPTYHIPDPDRPLGVRSNQGHEALAVTPEGSRMIVITESALVQDGPSAALEAGTSARLLVYDIASRQPVAEHVYVTEPVPVASTTPEPRHDNGITGALYLEDGRLLVMERSFARGVGTTVQIFEADLEGATNVLGREKLDAAGVVPVRKTHVIKLDSLRHAYDVDNLEGMARGPELDGRPTILLVSDNNFNRRGQRTQFILLQLGR